MRPRRYSLKMSPRQGFKIEKIVEAFILENFIQKNGFKKHSTSSDCLCRPSCRTLLHTDYHPIARANFPKPLSSQSYSPVSCCLSRSQTNWTSPGVDRSPSFPSTDYLRWRRCSLWGAWISADPWSSPLMTFVLWADRRWQLSSDQFCERDPWPENKQQSIKTRHSQKVAVEHTWRSFIGL